MDSQLLAAIAVAIVCGLCLAVILATVTKREKLQEPVMETNSRAQGVLVPHGRQGCKERVAAPIQETVLETV